MADDTTARSLLSTLRTAWDVSWLGPGIEDQLHTASELVYAEPHAKLRQIAPDVVQSGLPVLLVTPLAVPTTCWDLRPGQSLEAFLAGAEPDSDAGRPTYVIGYGAISFADRGMGFEHWIDAIIPTAVRRISERHGGAPVHLVGWSMGGHFALLTAAHDPALPIASVTAVGTPIDYSKNVPSRPIAWLDGLIGTRLMTMGPSVLGGVPAPVVQAMFRSLAPVREVTKPIYLAKNLSNREALARTEAIDRFIGGMPGYPGRLYNQLHTRIFVRNELTKGVLKLGAGHTVRLHELQAPLLFIGSTADAIASAAAVKGGLNAFEGASEVTYRQVTGLSHLGLIAAPAARDTSWPLIAEFLATHD